MLGSAQYRRRAQEAALRFLRNSQVILSVLAVVIGVASGLAAIAFRLGIALVQEFAFGSGDEKLASVAAELAWWHILLAPALGGLAVGLFVHAFLPDRRPHGVAEVVEANAILGGRLSLTTGIKAAVASAASLGVGASVGREGPVVHLGACLGAWAAKRLHLGRQLSRTLLGCGVAAAIAASFNAPLAGTFFALEVVIGHYAVTAFAPIVVAAVVGTIVSRIHYGDFPAFILPEMNTIASFWEFPAFVLLGIVSAAAAYGFLRSVFLVEDLFRKTPLPRWGHPALGGLAVGVIAVFFPQVLGVGYEVTDLALSESYGLWLLIALAIGKMAATAISLGSGCPGGVFSPALVIGAMVGGAFGVIATGVFPELSSGHGAYTLVGMGAVAGAVLGAPISTVLMMFELTGDYGLAIAVMIATAIASLAVQQTIGHSFFTWQLARRGVRLRGAQDVGLLRSMQVRDLMDAGFERVASETPLAKLRERLRASSHGVVFVVDEEGRLVGQVGFPELKDATFDTSHDTELIAVNLARQPPALLQARDSLETAVQLYGTTGEAHVPVVADFDSKLLLGVVHEHEVTRSYLRALSQARSEEEREG